MLNELFDIRMHDGSRQFASLPQIVFFDTLREHLTKLCGAVEIGFLTDWVLEVWLDFTFGRHQFSINNQSGEYWFFVENPECPDEILMAVYEHFRPLLEK